MDKVFKINTNFIDVDRLDGINIAASSYEEAKKEALKQFLEIIEDDLRLTEIDPEKIKRIKSIPISDKEDKYYVKRLYDFTKDHNNSSFAYKDNKGYIYVTNSHMILKTLPETDISGFEISDNDTWIKKVSKNVKIENLESIEVDTASLVRLIRESISIHGSNHYGKYEFFSHGIIHAYNALYLLNALYFCKTNKIHFMNEENSIAYIFSQEDGKQAIIMPIRIK